MKFSIRTLKNQDLIDIAIKYYGDADGVTSLMSDNNLSITDVIDAGTELLIDSDKIVNTQVAEYYKRNNINTTSQVPEQNYETTYLTIENGDSLTDELGQKIIL